MLVASSLQLAMPSISQDLKLTPSQLKQLDENIKQLDKQSHALEEYGRNLKELQGGLENFQTSILNLHASQAALARQQLPEMEKRLGQSNPKVLNRYTIIAQDYYLNGQYEEADKLFFWLLTAREKVHGKQSKEAGSALIDLAEVKCKEGQYKAAEVLYKRGITVLANYKESFPSCEKVQLDRRYSGLAACLIKEGKTEEAKKWQERAKSSLQK